jgi:6-phosphogluconolactonase
VINELNNTMSTIAYDAAQGTFTEIEALSTLPAGYAERSYCGDVHVTPDGRFVYGTNRGQNAVVGFSIDQATGKLTPVCWEPCQGDWPRNMAIDPTGRYLFSATHNSNNIVSFAIDTKTGKLTPTGNNLQLPVPMCVKFVTV